MSTQLLLVAAGMLVVGSATALGIGSNRWNRATARQVKRLLTARLDSDQIGSGRVVVSLRQLDGLPDPVVRYFRRVLPLGEPLPCAARIYQRGTFRLSRSDNSWKPFRANQVVSISPPGFVWDARISMAPGMTVRVRDSYCNGEGSMRGNMLSLIPLVDEHGRPELDQGALHRYLAEAVWLPTALLPDQGVRWTPIDDTSALAGLRHHGVEVSLEFRFNQVGEITRVFTPERYREVEGAYQPTPWEGTFGRYEVREGLLIPIEGEVAWILPEGRFSYWRGEVVEVDYEPDVKSCNQKR